MASGDSLLSWTAQGAQPVTNNFARQNLRNSHPVVDFDPTATEYVAFEDVLPRHYAGGGITVTAGWIAASATSGTARWGFSFERHQGSTDDLDSSALAAATQYMDSVAAGTSGQLVYTATAFTNGAAIDSIAVGEHFRLLVLRDAVNGNDTMAGDAELVSLELKET